MSRKLLSLSLCLSALVAPVTSFACGGGGGGGRLGGGGGLGGGYQNNGSYPNRNNGQNNGGYPVSNSQPSYPSPYDSPVSSPSYDQGAACNNSGGVGSPVATLQANTLTSALAGKGPFTVSLQHPLTGEFVAVKEFTNQSEAVTFKSAIERKLFVTTDSDYREAATISEANTIAAQLRGAGNQVKIAHAVAKITTGDEPNLSDVLAKTTPETSKVVAPVVETPAPAVVETAPVATVVPTTDPNAETSATLLEALKHAQAIQDAMKQGAVTKPAPVETMNPKLQPLVGEWTAVARTASGELSTVELQLDNRGWAKFTAPAKDGSKNTVERKMELSDNQELKLIGDDGEMLLGKVASLSADQLVLSQANGQVTFVRPR